MAMLGSDKAQSPHAAAGEGRPPPFAGKSKCKGAVLSPKGCSGAALRPQKPSFGMISHLMAGAPRLLGESIP